MKRCHEELNRLIAKVKNIAELLKLDKGGEAQNTNLYPYLICTYLFIVAYNTRSNRVPFILNHWASRKSSLPLTSACIISWLSGRRKPCENSIQTHSPQFKYVIITTLQNTPAIKRECLNATFIKLCCPFCYELTTRIIDRLA